MLVAVRSWGATRSRLDYNLIRRESAQIPGAVLPPTTTGIPQNATLGEHTRLLSQLPHPPLHLAGINITNNVAISVTAVQRIHPTAVSWGSTQAVTHTNRQAVR